MGRKRKLKRELDTIISITLRFQCPNTGELVIKVLEKFDFNFWHESCDLCGSHSSLSVDVLCSHCKVMHTYEISSS